MILSILISYLLAKKRGFSARPVFHCIWLFPFFLVELTHMFFQWSVWHENYTYLPFASIIKKAYLYSLFLPILRYQLYKPALLGSCSILIGTLLNRIVIAANNGRMPVYPSLSYRTGYFSGVALSNYDSLHILGDSQTPFWWLSDYIDIGFGILSIGDLFVHSFTIIILYSTLKALNPPS